MDVQLVDVQVFATARITLKPLVPVFPCFSKIVISLMDKVCINFLSEVSLFDAL